MKTFRVKSSLSIFIIGLICLSTFNKTTKGRTMASDASTTNASPPLIPMNAPEEREATTKPVIGGLERQVVFPGSISQGQIRARIHPMTGCELLMPHAPDGTKIAVLFGKSTSFHASAHHPVLLYFYGNGMCMADSLNVFNQFRKLGFNVVMADYEGYGLSDGTPSEPGCYAAADAAYDYLLTRHDIDQNRIVATGWSLGAAVAIDLASRRQVAGLATFSAFTNINDMGRTIAQGLPLAMLFSSRFDNLAKIGLVSCPVFMAHGMKEPLVPPEMLDRLAKAAKERVTIVRVDGAEHNDIFQRGGNSLYGRLKAFVNGVSPTTAPK